MQQCRIRDHDNDNNNNKIPNFNINDNVDVLIEILKKLDGRSLGIAASVCRLWCTLTRDDSLWEDLCFRHGASLSPAATVRPVVVALGGYKRLYMVCVRRVLSRLGDTERVRGARDSVQLSLSLFCVDYYERFGGDSSSATSSSSSLMFLCEPVNV